MRLVTAVAATIVLFCTAPFLKREETISLLSGTVDEHCRIAEAHLYFQHPEMAYKSYHRALAIDSSSARAYLGLADLWRSQHSEPNRAFLYATKAIEADAHYVDARLFRAELQLEYGDFAEAVVDLNNVLEVQPDSLHGMLLRAQALRRAGKLEKSLSDLNRFLELHEQGDRSRVGAFRLRGQVYDTLKDRSRALLDYEAAWKITQEEEIGIPDAEKAILLNGIAWIRATSPDEDVRSPARAVALASEMINYVGNSPGYLDTLAAALASDGRFAEAVTVQRAALAGASRSLVPELRERLELYENGKAYVDRSDEN